MTTKKHLIKMVIPALVLCSGIAYTGYVYSGYQKGKEEYASLRESFLVEQPEARSYGEAGMQEGTAGEAADDTEEYIQNAGTEEIHSQDQSGKTIWEPATDALPADAPPTLKVDWEALLKKNEDVVAWINVPAARISYPVMQAEDNEYYLHRDINREYLFAGSVFMDAYNNPSLFNYNTIIYGHNMRDGSMFASLKDFQDQKKLEECPYFWVCTPSADCLYRICSVHYAASGSDTFTVRFPDYETYQSWQERMVQMSEPSIDIRLEYQDRVVTLSTCTESSSTRMTVQGKLVWMG